MLLGKTLRQAREEKGLTISQVAEATRMMTQIIEDLEREDFRRIAAPIYGRGFIKLYAEYLGLDPEPLIQEFIEIYTGSRPPQIVRRPAEETEPSDGRTVGQLDGTTVEPFDRPTVEPSDGPDLFSLAAGHSEAVRSVADPAQPGESAPPRVRPVATPTTTVRLPALQDPTLRREPVKTPEKLVKEPLPQSSRSDGVLQWLSQQGKPVAIGVVAVLILLVLLGFLRRKHQTATPAVSNRTPIHVERVLPPEAPFFD